MLATQRIVSISDSASLPLLSTTVVRMTMAMFGHGSGMTATTTSLRGYMSAQPRDFGVGERQSAALSVASAQKRT